MGPYLNETTCLLYAYSLITNTWLVIAMPHIKTTIEKFIDVKTAALYSALIHFTDWNISAANIGVSYIVIATKYEE